MYPIVYQGIDTLDVAIQGAASPEVLTLLETYRTCAEEEPNNSYGVQLVLGEEQRAFAVKGHGMKGGYRYTLVDIKTGSIFAVKKERRQDLWNIFVSTRAHSLLSRGYEGMKAEIDMCLDAIGVIPTAYSVNRIDYAIDIVAPDFVLDMAHFVAPKNAKVSPHFTPDNTRDTKGQLLTDHGDKLPIGSVMRGGRYETVTVGKMPGRQVTVYDKTTAAKAQQTPYWFAAWGIDPDDYSQRVYRVEVRAGRDAWGAIIGITENRNYETVEGLHQRFLTLALNQIRYVTDRAEVTNVTRAQLHPLWETAQEAVASMPERPEPPLTPDNLRDLLRKQRTDMALLQGFGNLNNALVLQGRKPSEIARSFPQLTAELARQYIDEITPERHVKKLGK